MFFLRPRIYSTTYVFQTRRETSTTTTTKTGGLEFSNKLQTQKKKKKNISTCYSLSSIVPEWSSMSSNALSGRGICLPSHVPLKSYP